MGNVVAMLIPVFVIVFLFSMFALKESPISQMRLPLSFCTAFLSMLGLLTAFSGSPNDRISSLDGQNTFVGFILIPYTAQSLAFLTILAVVLFSKIKSWWRRLTSDSTDRACFEKKALQVQTFTGLPERINTRESRNTTVVAKTRTFPKRFETARNVPVPSGNERN
jgi:hypothetical protein